MSGFQESVSKHHVLEVMPGFEVEKHEKLTREADAALPKKIGRIDVEKSQ